MTDTTSAPDTPAALTSTSVLSFFAADHVEVCGNKVYVNGGFFNLLRYPTFPAIVPTLGIAAVLRIPFHDTMQDHVLRIGLRGPEHQLLPMRIEARFRTAPTPDAEFGEENIAPFGVTVSNVEIPTTGTYNLVLWLDNREIATYRMRALQIPMVMTTGIPPTSSDFTE